MSLASAALVSLLAFVAPLIVRLIRLPVPDIVVQILFGIIVGPQVLGWARIDEPVRVLSLIGLSFLLFLAGLELDFEPAARPDAADGGERVRALLRPRPCIRRHPRRRPGW